MLLRLFPFMLSSLPIFLLLIDPTFTQTQLEGKICVANQTQGVYKPLKQCPSLLKKWLNVSSATNMSESDYSNSMWCCPNEVTDNRTPTPDSRAKAKTKCEEYSRSADASPIPTMTMVDEEPNPPPLGKVETRPKEFPHMAAFGLESDDGIVWRCGGSVISETFVVTAAHCTYTDLDDASTFWIRVGDWNLKSTDDDANPQQIRVIERIRHPLYTKFSGYHDIALLKLEKKIHFNEWVRPLCLPYSLPDNAAPKATATGWGSADYGLRPSNVLLKVTMRLVPQLECNASYTDNIRRLPSGIVADWQLCAGEKGKDTCQGDAGGPLVIVNNDHPHMYSLIGITSLGKGCNGVVPSVYTRVYYYVPWIESIVWPNS